MPLYEYVCRDCQHEQELLVRGDQTPECENCGGRHMAKLLSVPAAPSTGEGAGGPRNFPGGGSCGSGCGCH